MPGKNGLELLKMVKKQWPLTKAVMMTAFASTDTALKSIRLGALDYISKPFTPAELRSSVDNAISGKLVETAAPAKERDLIDVIDIDAPFEAKEVIEQVGEDYAKMLGRSDMPVVEVKLPAALPNYCEVGTMVCDIFKKLGATCKAGTKTGECPQKKAKKSAAKSQGVDTRRLVGIDQPFSYDDVVSVTGPQYVQQLGREGVAYVPYEELKKNMAAHLKADAAQMDVDLPFNRREVEQYTDANYTVRLSRSDVPVVEVKVPESVPNYCQVGPMVCEIFKKLGATCKAGTKSGECPQLKSKKAKPAAARPAVDDRRLIGPDWPFDYEEVAAATGADYVRRLSMEGSLTVPYEELKRNMAALRQQPAQADSHVAKALRTRRSWWLTTRSRSTTTSAKSWPRKHTGRSGDIQGGRFEKDSDTALRTGPSGPQDPGGERVGIAGGHTRAATYRQSHHHHRVRQHRNGGRRSPDGSGRLPPQTLHPGRNP